MEGVRWSEAGCVSRPWAVEAVFEAQLTRSTEIGNHSASLGRGQCGRGLRVWFLGT